jgi:histidinol-phosphate aminotransferase
MRSINYVEQERSALVSFFTEIGVEVIPSAANFLTVRLGDGAPVTADRVVALLAEEGVLVRGLANYGLADCLRITIGPAEDLERLRASILKILSGVKRSG